jgi:serine/threonine-protein kinase
MDSRYEILGKIGQGGLGSVYRGHDTRMNREVAIKRISRAGSDLELEEESTRQLLKEAGALASLQHPNIVTIHDVGTDADGPYVVMELIDGKTLDEHLDRAPLTWPDFKELAMQTLEALIAAQEHQLIHSDLKPSNLMLTWLPSGKFQIKIVDFGLASLSKSQSMESLKSIDVVFGSIFFMPPEQFERQALDIRSDMYSIGCVFYQALAGRYPFNGKTGNEVMDAHLHHKVAPLMDVRSGVPTWASDWVMWHINRFPKDRPESAREALSLFLQNDRVPNPPMSTGVPPVASGPPLARVRMPGETTSHEPGIHHPTPLAVPHAIVEASGVPGHKEPLPLMPPEGLKPSVHTSSIEIPETQSQPSPTRRRAPSASREGSHTPAKPTPARKMGKGAKIALICAGTAILLGATGVIFKLNQASANARTVGKILTQAEASGTREVPITGKSLDLLLDSITRNEVDGHVQRICSALAKAQSKDSTNVDLKVAEFAARREGLSTRTRELLISNVLTPRGSPAILPAMLETATLSKDPEVIISALQSIRPIMEDSHFDKMLRLLTESADDHVRDAAEANLFQLLKNSPDPAALVGGLTSARTRTYKPEILQALKRLISFGTSLSSRNS